MLPHSNILFSTQRLDTDKKVRAQGIKIKPTQTHSTIFSTERERGEGRRKHSEKYRENKTVIEKQNS
jgi:hypothetical protein